MYREKYMFYDETMKKIKRILYIICEKEGGKMAEILKDILQRG